MMMSLTSELTTVPKAPPMITPMASARAFVFRRKARNSPTIGSSVERGRLAPEPPREASVADDLLERLRLVDPALDHGLRWDVAHRVPPGVQLLERLGEVLRVPAGQLRGGVDAGRLQHVGILRADAVQAHQ